MQHKARKRFGQNFLHDPSVIDNIVNTFHPAPGEHVVEIGPGLGAMTRLLLLSCKSLDVIELDRDLIEHLETHVAPLGDLRIHNCDVLKFDFSSLGVNKNSLRVIGNLPYNISTPLIFHLIDSLELVQDMCFMLQKEVVERLVAKPGSKEYGRLSVMVQYYCDVEKLFTIGPGAFKPAPKVDSAIVYLQPRKTIEPAAIDTQQFAKIVTAAFAHRRKTLRNNLKHLLNESDYQHCTIDPANRAETLSVNDFVCLANRFSETQ
ncbi:MAG: 16S rRNA (adenine(1518)-N(6)/adenine(1519)-N(6))-dimethyltransferase RsmA [Gammaproteobacteria bacterium]|nr:16S rRNA (adenine(1518)-N(6)/adenine(1519)-N(6))-dimethyltransferase RsmA [Gammaproteobacteria bacterium]